MALATLVQPRFMSPANLRDVLVQAAPLLMVTMGQAFVILVRGLDLSVASLMATVAVLATAFNATSDAAIGPIFVTAIAFSAAVGLANGWLVARRDVSPFLATLAMMILLQGVRFSYTQGAPAGTLPQGFRVLGAGDWLGMPINLMAALALAVVLWAVLHRGVFGRHVFHRGRQPEGGDAGRHPGRSHHRAVLRHLLGDGGNRGPVPGGFRGHGGQLGRARLRARLDRCRGDGRGRVERRSRQHRRCAARRIAPGDDLQRHRHHGSAGAGPVRGQGVQ